MPNPPILPFDSDVLIQFFLARELRPLSVLQRSYGIQPVIVTEVDLELRRVGKYKARFARFVPDLDKALRNQLLRILDETLFQSLLSNAPTGASWAAFQSLGSEYYKHVQRGEAYTHAAAITLGLPAVSNDYDAIQTLEAQVLALPTPVLRGFDLLAFCHGTGAMTLRECDDVRQELRRHNEGIPKAFMNASFEDGMKSFTCRLLDGAPSLQAAAASYRTPLTIQRI